MASGITCTDNVLIYWTWNWYDGNKCLRGRNRSSVGMVWMGVKSVWTGGDGCI